MINKIHQRRTLLVLFRDIPTRMGVPAIEEDSNVEAAQQQIHKPTLTKAACYQQRRIHLRKPVAERRRIDN